MRLISFVLINEAKVLSIFLENQPSKWFFYYFSILYFINFHSKLLFLFPFTHFRVGMMLINLLSFLFFLECLCFYLTFEGYFQCFLISRWAVLFFQDFKDATISLSSGLYYFCWEVSCQSYCCCLEGKVSFIFHCF